MSHGGFGQDPGQSLQEHAGYQCLGCKRTWSSLFALGQHTGSPYMRGTRCGSLSSIVELRTVDLASGLVQTVPVHVSGTLLIHSIYAYCET